MNNKNRKWKCILSILMCAVLLSGCAASKTTSDNSSSAIVMEKEESRAVSISFIGGKDVMPISGMWGPYELARSSDGNVFPYYVTDEYYQMLADCGLNMISYTQTDYATSPDVFKKTMDLAAKYGMGLFVTDSNILNKVDQDDITKEEVAKELVNYADHEAFCGLYVVDEPQATYYSMGDGSRLLQKYEQLADVLHNELNVLTYANLFPIFDEREKDNYERYVNEFCEIYQPKILMWDFYPFEEKRDGDMRLYLYNMSLIREKAEELGIPFWAYIPAGSQWNDGWGERPTVLPYFPNEYQTNWNINTCLAMGVQGIQYFPIMQVYQFTLAENGGFDFQRNGLIGAMGNKNQWFYYAQKINKHIAAIDEVLMNSVNKGIILSGKQANRDAELVSCVIESGTFNQLQSVSGETMVGCFNYNGKTALYVVNYSFEKAQHITLEFNGTQNIRKVQGAETSYVKGEALTLDMAAGEGILLVLE